MKTLLITFVLACTFIHSASANENQTSLVEVCKSDCPKAKTDEEAHKCAEKKGRLNKDFRKSKCWEVNEIYEKANAKK